MHITSQVDGQHFKAYRNRVALYLSALISTGHCTGRGGGVLSEIAFLQAVNSNHTYILYILRYLVMEHFKVYPAIIF